MRCKQKKPEKTKKKLFDVKKTQAPSVSYAD